MIEQFFRPDSVEQALELKRRYQDEAVWFAGGSKLNATPTRTDKKIAISLQDLELDWVDWDNGALRIGAMSRLQPLRDARFIPAALREALCAVSTGETALHLRLFVEIQIDLRLHLKLPFKFFPVFFIHHEQLPPYFLFHIPAS